MCFVVELDDVSRARNSPDCQSADDPERPKADGRSVQVCGGLCRSVEVCAGLCRSVQVCGCLYRSVGVCAGLCRSVGVCRGLWGSMLV